MLLSSVITYIILTFATCQSTELNVTVNPQDESIVAGDSVKDTLEDVRINSVLEKESDCEGGCNRTQEPAPDSTIPTSRKKYKKANTPPKSYNLLATLQPGPSIGKGPLVDKIGIIQLSEKSQSNFDKDVDDWSIDSDYELMPESDRIEKYSSNDSAKSESTEAPSIHHIKKYTIESNDETIRKNIVKKNNYKFPKIKKFYNVNLFKTNYTGSSNFTNQTTSTSMYDYHSKFQIRRSDIPNYPTKNATEQDYLFGDRIPDLNHSFRLIPYPVYFTAKPIIHRKKLIIPYPYFVLKSDKKDHSDKHHKRYKDDKIEDKVRLAVSNPRKNDSKEYNELSVMYDIDYGGIENDEDYIPATAADDDDYIIITHEFVTTTRKAETSGTTSRTRPVGTTSTTRYSSPVKPVSNTTDSTQSHNHSHINISSTEYPNPYKNGTIYNYYDCVVILNKANFNSEYDVAVLVSLIVYLVVFM